MNKLNFYFHKNRRIVYPFNQTALSNGDPDEPHWVLSLKFSQTRKGRNTVMSRKTLWSSPITRSRNFVYLRHGIDRVEVYPDKCRRRYIKFLKVLERKRLCLIKKAFARKGKYESVRRWEVRKVDFYLWGRHFSI